MPLRLGILPCSAIPPNGTTASFQRIEPLAFRQESSARKLPPAFAAETLKKRQASFGSTRRVLSLRGTHGNFGIPQLTTAPICAIVLPGLTGSPFENRSYRVLSQLWLAIRTEAPLKSFRRKRRTTRQFRQDGRVPSPHERSNRGFILFSHGGEGAPRVCRTNLFACHNLFLAPPGMPLASPACNTRIQDPLQPQTKQFALLSSLLTTLPNSPGTCSAISKTAIPDGGARTLTGHRRCESHFANPPPPQLR